METGDVLAAFVALCSLGGAGMSIVAASAFSEDGLRFQTAVAALLASFFVVVSIVIGATLFL